MNARTLFDAGELDQAIEVLGTELRQNPTDLRGRTFLFELLCFAGEYDRAEKQLDVLARDNRDAEQGAWLYRSALHGSRTRRDMFVSETYDRRGAGPPAVAGRLNGQPFDSLSDADPRIGARLEVLVAGQYTWIPLEHIAAIRIEKPTRLRDLLWIPARVQAGPSIRDLELGEVLLPVMTALAWQHPDGAVRLGRRTEWQEADGLAFPVGQKLLLVDGEPFPILEVRDLEIAGAAGADR